ncbi:MAG TPA: ADP compounds hydrolase NudE [Rhodanobacteraceae bacterium]|jgi:ADP-ribose diphosphatase|nr:ADP compounds hydrolase NudE [Rhodanobacteraceae bacterium]
MPTPPEILARRDARDSRFLHVEEVDLAFSNGARRTFERLTASGQGAVFIVAMRDADTVLLVREYGAGLDRYELGVPKGRIDPGETALQAADRELQEEAGFGARKLTPLITLSLLPAYMSHKAQVILAQDLYPQSRPGDEPERLEVVPWRLSELPALLARDDVSEGRSIAALFVAREYLAGRYQPGHPA